VVSLHVRPEHEQVLPALGPVWQVFPPVIRPPPPPDALSETPFELAANMYMCPGCEGNIPEKKLSARP
jgi:hypothetical protein